MSYKLKIIFFCFTSFCSLGAIVYLFYSQEYKFMSPTPVPQNYKVVNIGTKMEIDEFIPNEKGKMVFFHFFNPVCQCSRFNAKHFSDLYSKFKNNIKFYVIIQGDSENLIEEFNSKYELNVPCILDADRKISELFGIYSAPQAVILDKQHNIYYKGNYNKARFCTEQKTTFAVTALNSLLDGKSISKYSEEATKAYGCSIPIDEK